MNEWETRWSKALTKVGIECSEYSGITNHGVLIWFGARMLWLRPYRSKSRRTPMLVRSFLYLPDQPTKSAVSWVSARWLVAEQASNGKKPRGKSGKVPIRDRTTQVGP